MAAFESAKAEIEARYQRWQQEDDPSPRGTTNAPALRPAGHEAGIALIKGALEQVEAFKSFNASDVRREPPEQDSGWGGVRGANSFGDERRSDVRSNFSRPTEERGWRSRLDPMETRDSPGRPARDSDAGGWRDRLDQLGRARMSRSYGWFASSDQRSGRIDIKS